MNLHLQGMWVAFVVAAMFIVYFVQRVTSALSQRDQELARNRKIAALATMSAGAAHELATPLSTIAVIAKELQRRIDPDRDAAQDVELIRQQVQRCRHILDQMAAKAGLEEVKQFESILVSNLVRASLSDPRVSNAVEVVFSPDAESAQVYGP